MNATPVLETQSEIVAALKAQKDFESNNISGRQLDRAYVISFRGEDWAFICMHGDLYINLDLSARHMMEEMAKSGPEKAELLEDQVMAQADVVRAAFPSFWSEENTALLGIDRFAIACAIHNIPADQWIVDNMKDRGKLKSFLHMSFRMLLGDLGE